MSEPRDVAILEALEVVLRTEATKDGDELVATLVWQLLERGYSIVRSGHLTSVQMQIMLEALVAVVHAVTLTHDDLGWNVNVVRTVDGPVKYYSSHSLPGAVMLAMVGEVPTKP